MKFIKRNTNPDLLSSISYFIRLAILQLRGLGLFFYGDMKVKYEKER